MVVRQEDRSGATRDTTTVLQLFVHAMDQSSVAPPRVAIGEGDAYPRATIRERAGGLGAGDRGPFISMTIHRRSQSGWWLALAIPPQNRGMWHAA